MSKRPFSGERLKAEATGAVIGTLLLLLPVAVGAQTLEEQKKQPPPEFTSGYRPFEPTAPLPRAELFAYADVAVLLLTLSLAAYLALTKRSRSGLRALSLFSLLYFGFYRQGCICAVGSVQNVALALGNSGHALPFTVGAVFLLPLAFALFFGRGFCAAVCPLGALQELVLLRPRRVPPALEHALSLLPYLYLGAGAFFAWTGSAFLICRYDPFVGFFRLSGPTGVMAFGVALLVLSTFIGRPYCRFLCPYGVLLRWAGLFARWRVHVAPTACVNCHLCADACPFGALRLPSPGLERKGRREAQRRLAGAIALVPVLVLTGVGLGRLGSPAMARLNRTVALAERVWQEERGQVRGTTEAAAAWHGLGRPNGELYRQAREARRRIDFGAGTLGAWAGLTIGLKLIALSLRRKHEGYDADPAACLSCGRCYAACPVEQQRLAAPDLPGIIPLEPRREQTLAGRSLE